jgi:predicted MFS family arabinose efflux permease
MRFLARVFLPFALGYFLSYALRTVNAIIAPQLSAELALTPASLGFLTAGYFLAFAAMQVPLGAWLDTYPPRKVEALLLLVAAVGTFLFATAHRIEMLVIARALIGVGVCCCLMASLRSFSQWLPPQRLPFTNGIQLAVGSIGAMSATLPTQALIPSIGWRGIFLGLAVLLVVASLWLWFLTPDPPHQIPPPIPAAQVDPASRSMATISAWKSPIFWTLMPIAALNTAHGMSMQALWASPWLIDVVGVPMAKLGSVLIMVSVGMMLGNFMSGVLATWFAPRGVLPHRVAIGLCIVAVFTQMPMIFGLSVAPALLLLAFGLVNCAGNLVFASLNHFFAPQVLGRVYTAFNLSIFLLAFVLQWLTGVIVNAYPKLGGGYEAAGYRIAFATITGLQILALIWFFCRRNTLRTLV